MRHVFIIGSKGIPAGYGGFETFVDELVSRRTSSEICYHVSCADNGEHAQREFEYKGVHCFRIAWRPIGPARAIAYDVEAFRYCLDYIKGHGIEHPIVYVLACRIGPMLSGLARKLHALGGSVFVNPDGHEWKRAKWSYPVRRYWKLSERLCVKAADLVVCDSQAIEAYIGEEHRASSPHTCYIAYGAECPEKPAADVSPELDAWLRERGTARKGYFLTVGRFVPENNLERIVAEFMASDSKRKLLLISDAEGPKLERFKRRTGCEGDERIVFAGSVYDRGLLEQIREGAFAYIHGHEVGGTNPSLLEALAATQLSLVLNVGFNRELARDAALYWSKEKGSLGAAIAEAEKLDAAELERFDRLSSDQIRQRYSWDFIVSEYEGLFLSWNDWGN